MLPEPIQTKRLLLRAPLLDDAPILYELLQEKDIARTTANIPHPYPEDLAMQWIENKRYIMQEGDAEMGFLITSLEHGNVLGGIGLRIDNEHQAAEVGYWIGKPYWGNGYATEALQAIIEYGFTQLNLNRIFADYQTDNLASRRVMEKCGMTFEGILRQHVIKWGEFKDLGVLSILREEFKQNS
jgi:RimJ/RimL family protein N-acetyltransferase